MCFVMSERQTLIIVLGSIVVFQLIVLCQALHKGDEGVCEKELPVFKTSYKRISIKAKCPKGSKECTTAERDNLRHFNKKNERCCSKRTTVREKKLICCSGWEYIKSNESCRAQCRNGCEDGRCVAPDRCECDPPLLLVNGNKCLQPVCDPPCVNGQCVANNTCKCVSDFETLNHTHCAEKCELGFINDPLTLECIPKCDDDCCNGVCTAPNVCECFKGYSKNDSSCVPVCDPPCKNGICDEPNVCKCNDGYENDRKNKFECLPICNPRCVNASCVSVNTCECHKGYEIAGSNWICKPKCGSCENGDCIAPNKCICHKGYTKINSKCVPQCENCEFGECIAPNECKCHIGYTKVNGKCAPTCDTCDNGECIAPNDCKCHEGYSKINDTCAPKCDEPCINGFCSTPNNCTCHDGYELDIKDKFSCLPKCEKGCTNANCTLPNTCTCYPGYEHSDDKSICKPTCKSCFYGECVAPNKCKCDEGYDMIDGKCSPVCAVFCVNGYCSSPNTCTCIDGYKKDSSRSPICFKPCKELCDPGICSLHGICRCDKGYQLVNDSCSPITPVDCATCQFNCTSEGCWCDDERSCIPVAGAEAEVSTTTGLAGLELSWTLLGAVGLLLLTLVMFTMHRLYRRRKDISDKIVDDGNPYGSVVYNMSVPNKLVQRNDENLDDEEEEMKRTGERLLTPELVIKDEKL